MYVVTNPTFCHNGCHHVLLDIEFAGVEAPCIPQDGELPGQKDCFQEGVSREGEQLSDTSCDRNARLMNAEELVDKPSVKESICQRVPRIPSVWQGSRNVMVVDIPGCNEDCSDKPNTKCARGNRGVIMIVNHSTNLGVWRVLAK